jgi:TetR/AcrR family fatty acid metabolism transcriptional regulator
MGKTASVEMTDPRSERQLAILRAAARVFAERGYHASTIADIAREAGVATGTVYLYVKRKEELLIMLFTRFFGRHLEGTVPHVLEEPTGAGRLRRLIELHVGFFDKDPRLAKVFQLHLREVNPTIRAGIRPTTRAYFDLIEEVVRAGVASGDFDPELDVRLARTLLFGALDSMVTSWVLSDQSYSLSSRIGPIYTMLARALGATRA